MKNVIIIILMFILASAFAIADNTIYPYLSGDDQDYLQGNAFFNTATVDDVTFQTTSIDDYSFAPLVDDLDGVSPKDIVIIDETRLVVLQSNGVVITLIDDIDLGTVPITPPYIYDIDNDGTKEIILMSSSNISMFVFNGSLITKKYDVTPPNTLGGGLSGMVACKGTDDCLFVRAVQTNDRYIIAQSFNRTNASIETQIFDAGTDDVCLPYLRNIVVNDYDEDNTDEFLFSFYEVSQSGTDNVHVYQVDISGTIPIVEASDVKNLDWSAGDPTTQSCNSLEIGKRITSPVTLNFKGGGEDELLIGASVSSNEYRLYLFDETLNFDEQYPKFFDVEGEIISNPIITDTYSLSGTEDVCLVGYNDVGGEVRILCASERGNIPDFALATVDSREFEYTINVSGINPNYYDLSSLSHSVKSISTLTEGHNPNEILTSLGVFSLNLDSVSANLIWSNPKGEATIIPVDYSNDGRSELIMLTDTNLWIATDGVINTHCDTYACIRSIETNPCILDGVGKTNSSLSVSVLVEDFDAEAGLFTDKVAVKVDLYVNTPNEQTSGWSANQSSGTTFSITDLELNQSISLGIMRISARDTDDPTKIDTEDLTFSVSDVGLSFGECTSSTIPDSVTIPVVTTPTTVDGTSIITEGGLGSPCSSSTQCDSEQCNYGYCSLKLGGSACASSDQCVSTQCINDRCTKPSASQVINSAKNEQVGDDDKSNNILSLIISAGLMVLLILFTRGHIAGIIAGIFLFISGLIFFTFLGWLNPLFLFGGIVVLIFAVVFMVIISGNS